MASTWITVKTLYFEISILASPAVSHVTCKLIAGNDESPLARIPVSQPRST